MPMPTTSPLFTCDMSSGSSVSSRMFGSPQVVPVAAASTYSQRGVMTATPNDRLLGLIRWTRTGKWAPLKVAVSYCVLERYEQIKTCPRTGGEETNDGTPFQTNHEQTAA